MKNDNELILKVAWYYYIENLKQQEIAEKLNLSRIKVIRLLESARELGIIQFKISQNSIAQLPIEQQLRDKWNLNHVKVMPTPNDKKALNNLLATCAANYLSTLVTENTFINIGYGDTPSKVLNHLANITDVPVSFVSLTGGVSYYLPNTTTNVFKAMLHLYPAPLLLSSEETCSALLKEPTVLEINRMIPLSSFSIVGIGAMNNDATIISNGIMSPNDFSYLKMQGAVGDILTHFIDIDGNPIMTPFEDRLISTPLQQLKNMKNVFGIAGGKEKETVIRSALKGGFIDSLITDEETATLLLNK